MTREIYSCKIDAMEIVQVRQVSKEWITIRTMINWLIRAEYLTIAQKEN